MAILFECDIAIEIGARHFRIPRSLLSSPHNSPNYFTHSVSFTFANPAQVFPGLDRNNLLRPPSIRPLHIDNRDPDIFEDILRLVRGYDVHIQNEEHRAALIRDSRYYQFRQVEQRLVPHEISYNLVRRKEEIVIRLEHLRLPGLKFIRDENNSGVTGGSGILAGVEWLHYSRPLVDEKPYELIVQIDGESMLLDIDNMQLIPHGVLRAKMRKFIDAVKKRYGENLGVKVDTGENTPATASPSPITMPVQQPLAPPVADQDLRIPVQFARETSASLDGLFLGKERANDFGIAPNSTAAAAAAAAGTANNPNGAKIHQTVITPTPSSPSIPIALTSATAGPVPNSLNEPLKRPRPAEMEAITNPSKRLNRTIDTQQPAQHSSQQQPEQPQPIGSSTGSAAGTQSLPDRLNKPAKLRSPWILNNSQWRLRVRPIVSSVPGSSVSTTIMNNDEKSGDGTQSQASGNKKVEVIFVAVKIEAYTGERARNKQRRFL